MKPAFSLSRPLVYSPSRGGLRDLRELQANWDTYARVRDESIHARIECGRKRAQCVWLAAITMLAVLLPIVVLINIFRLLP